MEHRKYYVHADGLNDEKTKPLIDFINNTPGDLVIGLNCGGGSEAMRCFVQQLLAENADRITLVAMVGIYSAAFELFYKYDGVKVLTNGVAGMYHLASLNAHINANGNPEVGEAAAIFEGVKMTKLECDNFAASFMTPSEIKKYRKGEDVYFGFKRMKEIFPDVPTWN